MKQIDTTTISSKGQITIPTKIRHALKIQSGQTFTFHLRKDGILIKPVDVEITDKTATDEWEQGIKAAMEDIKAGRVRRFQSEKALMAHLDRLGAKKKT